MTRKAKINLLLVLLPPALLAIFLAVIIGPLLPRFFEHTPYQAQVTITATTIRCDLAEVGTHRRGHLYTLVIPNHRMPPSTFTLRSDQDPATYPAGITRTYIDSGPPAYWVVRIDGQELGFGTGILDTNGTRHAVHRGDTVDLVPR